MQQELRSQHLQRLSPHGLHWPIVDESLDTAALTSVSLMLLGRWNATTGGSGTTWPAFHFFQFLSNDDGQCLKFSPKRDGRWEQGEPVCWSFFCTPGHYCLFHWFFENPLSITLSLYPRLFKWWRKSPSHCLVVSTVEHIRFILIAWLNGILLKQCLGWQLLGERYWCLPVGLE